MTLDDVRNLDKESLLNKFGLQTNQSALWSVLPGSALFGVGLLAGVGIGILFAPRAGREIREDIRNRVGDLKSRAKGGIRSKLSHVTEQSTSPMTDTVNPSVV